MRSRFQIIIPAHLIVITMDEVHLIDDIERLCRRKNYYQKHDPFESLSDEEFRHRYRMTKQSFCRLLSLIEEKISSDDPRSTPPHMQLLLALRFYAAGNFHYTTGDLLGYSAGHVCKIIARVSSAIASMFPQFISFPSNEELKKVSLPAQITILIIMLRTMQNLRRSGDFLV